MPYNVGAWRALGQLGKIVREEEEKYIYRKNRMQWRVGKGPDE